MKPAAQSDFSRGSAAGHVLRIAVPITVAQLVNVLYNVVDRIYLGRLAGQGTQALAGVGLVAPVIAVVSAFVNLCGYGAAPLFSMARGAGDDGRAARIMGNALTMLLATSAALTAALLAFRPPILRLVGASPGTFGAASDYLGVYALGTAFAMVGTGMNSFINAQGFGAFGMATILIGAVVNIALDPVFIFALGLGVRGAAIATVVGQACSCAWVLAFLCGRRPPVRLRAAAMRPDPRVMGRSAALGASGFLMATTTSATGIVFNVWLSRLGGDMYVAVMTVIASIQEIMLLPGVGLRQGATPVISYNYGAGRTEAIRRAFRFMTVLGLAVHALLWGVAMLFPAPLIRAFNPDPAVVEAGVRAFRAFFLVFFLMTFQSSGQTGFVSLGLTRYAICFSVLRKCVIVIPLTFALARAFPGDPVAVLYAEPASHVFGSCTCFAAFMLVVWRRLPAFVARAREAKAKAHAAGKA